jgi:hypothetical protein
MDMRNGQIRNSIELILCALVFLGIIALINQTDNAIRVRKQPFHILSNSFLPQGRPFINDEARISTLFDEDTLPRLIQFGLVKKYELTQFRTTLFVDGRLWKQRSQFFKSCLLTEILVHNKVNGYAQETQIVDNHSRKLFARITPSLTFAFFD